MDDTKKLMLIHEQETHAVIGAAMAVHRHFGCGFTEKVYQDALEVEFQHLQIPYLREHAIYANYRGKKLSTEFKPDFLCYDKVIVELKAVKEQEDLHRAQAINYAHVAGYDVALLINFGQPSLQFERFTTRRKSP